MFCPAIPLLLPFASLFMFASHRVDRYNLLRVMKPPPRTTDRTITLSVLYLLPLALFAHIWMVLFFYSKQARSLQTGFAPAAQHLHRPLGAKRSVFTIEVAPPHHALPCPGAY